MAYVRVSPLRVRVVARGKVRPFMTRLGYRISNGATLKANVDTGRMRAAISVDSIDDGWGCRISCRVSYALYVHEGTRAHEIRASPGPGRKTAFRHLAFKGADGGMVFRRRVWHPGYGGNPFLRDAMVEAIHRL